MVYKPIDLGFDGPFNDLDYYTVFKFMIEKADDDKCGVIMRAVAEWIYLYA